MSCGDVPFGVIWFQEGGGGVTRRTSSSIVTRCVVLCGEANQISEIVPRWSVLGKLIRSERKLCLIQTRMHPHTIHTTHSHTLSLTPRAYSAPAFEIRQPRGFCAAALPGLDLPDPPRPPRCHAMIRCTYMYQGFTRALPPLTKAYGPWKATATRSFEAQRHAPGPTRLRLSPFWWKLACTTLTSPWTPQPQSGQAASAPRRKRVWEVPSPGCC
jgi:hypothetical protein